MSTPIVKSEDLEMDSGRLFARQDVAMPPFLPVLSESSLSALIWIELIACLIFVGLRTWVQYTHSKRLFSNDYLIFFALVCHIGAVATCQRAMPYIYGIEKLKLVMMAGGTPSLSMAQSAQTFLRYQFALLLLLWTTLWAVKFSLLIFFWRLFDSVHTRVRIFWFIMIVITASTYIVTIFIQLFACGSPSNFFKLDGCAQPHRLYLSNLVFLFSAGTDIAGDFLILLIPFPLLWKLRTTPNQKAILVIIFLLPLVPIVFGVLRLVFCNPTTGVVNVIKFQLFSLLENTAAIITACLPSFRLFVTGSRSISNSSSRGGGRNAPYYQNGFSGITKTGRSREHPGSIRLGSSAAKLVDEQFDPRAFERIASAGEAYGCHHHHHLNDGEAGKEFEVTELAVRRSSERGVAL